MKYVKRLTLIALVVAGGSACTRVAGSEGALAASTNRAQMVEATREKVLQRFPDRPARIVEIASAPVGADATIICGRVQSGAETLPFVSLHKQGRPPEKTSVSLAKVGDHTPATDPELEASSNLAREFCSKNGLAEAVR
jgi:hypothetical protein